MQHLKYRKITLQKKYALFLKLNALGLAIGFARVDLLASLLDGLQDSGVVESWLSDDSCGLGVKGDII